MKWNKRNSQVKECLNFKQELDLTNTSSRICHLLQGSSQNTKVKMSPACEDVFTSLSKTRFDVSWQSEGLIYWKSARRSVLLLPKPFPYMSFLTLLALFLTDLGGKLLISGGNGRFDVVFHCGRAAETVHRDKQACTVSCRAARRGGK